MRKYKDNNAQNDYQCLCINKNHTTYNELAITFPLDESQKLSNLFKSILNKEEISDEKNFFSFI